MDVPFFFFEGGIYMAFGLAINLGVRSGNATKRITSPDRKFVSRQMKFSKFSIT